MGGGGGSYFLKRGVRKKGGSREPPEPPLATGLVYQILFNTIFLMILDIELREIMLDGRAFESSRKDKKIAGYLPGFGAFARVLARVPCNAPD